jgi:DNA-binding response OmpR family regulator
VRILVVEDEKKIASALKRGLTAEGFTVDVANDGVDGLSKATEIEYDIIVLDILLPLLNGFAVCAKLRERGVWTPILMLTAKLGEYDEAEALDTGADDYLTKPFSFIVLVAHISALLRRNGHADPTISYRVGSLSLDPRLHQVIRDGNLINLTAREFSVLEYLMRFSDRVVTKREILDQIWDIDFDGDPNIVEVFVRRIRLKIDSPFSCKSIETVRGVGYRLINQEISE